MVFFKTSHWQSWVCHLFTSHWVVYFESSFRNVGNDLGSYLALMVTNCSGERSFPKLNMVE